MKKLLTLCLLLLATPAFAADVTSVQLDNTKATLLAARESIAPGQPFTLGVLLEPRAGWHTYWENPGDAGIPTTLQWTLPPGFTAGNIDWPAPSRLNEGPLTTFGYKGSSLLPVVITPPASLVSTAYTIKVRADWLVCDEICVPESADLSITLPMMMGAPPSETAGQFTAHAKNRPQPLTASYYVKGNDIMLVLPALAKNIKSAAYFPRESNIIQNAAEQTFKAEKDALVVTIAKNQEANPDRLTGIVTLATADGTKHYDVTLGRIEMAGSQTETFLPLLLLFALLGGLILNLMPCVLPVLSLKALAIVKKAGHDHKTVVRMGLAYTLGILVSFAVIAGLLIALREGGESVGWGYQMQSPAFVGFLILLLFGIGLNLSGVFHLPVLFGKLAHDIDDETSARGSFFTGVLATAVATPCTAPFMASAIGVALTLPPLQAILIFEALGFGLALPFLLISIFPALRRFLPRPGAWMETFKKILAWPMYLSVVWLLWVLGLQTGFSGLVVALLGMAALAAVLRFRPSLLACALVLLLSLPILSRLEINSAERVMETVEKMGAETVEFSKEKLAQLRAAGKPVFVDATAAWCITCQVNARIAIHRDDTIAAFKEHGVTLMIADWTLRNDDITEFLTGFGYKGVPLYVYYPPDNGKPVVLPQLLTEDIVINAITPKGE